MRNAECYPWPILRMGVMIISAQRPISMLACRSLCRASVRGRTKGCRRRVTKGVLSAGAGFVVVLCGKIMTMPGLPKEPAAVRIRVDDEGNVTGLS